MNYKKHITTYDFLGKPSFLCNTPIYYVTIDRTFLQEVFEQSTYNQFKDFTHNTNICKNCLRIFLKVKQK